MEYPPVSVVMPVRNEERHLAESVRHVLGQDYPGPMELILAVGPSADRTEQIARDLAREEPRITVVTNPSGRIATALNLALRTARHQVIARIDGHALFPPDYVKTAVAILAETGAADVGGVMAAAGGAPFQQAGAGGMTSKAGPADSVYLGVYRRDLIEQAGGWDEEMLRAEDWELNYRIRARGGLVWFSPDLQVTYRPRENVRRLGSQYSRYGRWRRVVMRDHPETASSRYLAPPMAAALNTIGLLAGLAGLAGLAAGAPVPVPALTAGLPIPLIYLAGITAVSAALSRDEPAGVRARLPLVLAVMHLCWGAGFLTSPRGLHRTPAIDTPECATMDHGLRPAGPPRGS